MAGHFVPRSDGSSNLGTADKAFGTVYAKAGNISGELVVGSISKSDGTPIGGVPIAGSATLGGVKIGENINVAADGTISTSAYTLPAASTETLGGVKVGTNLSVTADGTLSAVKTITVDSATVNATPIAGGYIWIG